MTKTTIILLSFFIMASCQKKSTIQVQNMLSKAVIKNVEWGKLPIGNQILPGQSSSKITLYEDNTYYDIELPASNPVKFYIDVNGDKVYVQTKASYRLDKDAELTIVIEDTTKVFNPLLEKK